MPEPRQGEGGETVEVIRDVVVTQQAVSRMVAWNASRTALRYAFQADFLPFAHTTRVDNDSSRIVRIGAYSPVEYANHQGTVICNPREINRNTSFVVALKALHRVSGSDFADSDWANIMLDLDSSSIPLHPDYGTYSRSFIQLAGIRILSFLDETAVNSSEKYKAVVLSPGDAYSMQFRDDETSILHAADYMGWPYSVGIYINHKPE